MSMPITSKKQSQAKQDWMKANSRMVSVRIMKNTEADIYEFLQGKEAATIIKKALREYIENHKGESE